MAPNPPVHRSLARMRTGPAASTLRASDPRGTGSGLDGDPLHQPAHTRWKRPRSGLQATPGSTWWDRLNRSWNDLDPETQRFVACLVLGTALPLLLLLASGLLLDLVLPLFLYVVFAVAPLYLFTRGLYRWAQNETSFVGAFLGELRPCLPGYPLGTDLPRQGVPVVTGGLILANVVIHLGEPDLDVYSFLLHEPTLWLWSNFTALFLHIDALHLGGNMLFLWIFGSAVEGRVSRGRYLVYYLLAGSVGNIAQAAGSLALGYRVGWLLGASGAISGIMGLFLVRCYFARVSVSIPTLGPLPVGHRIRVSGLVLVSVFFLLDLAGARDRLQGVDTGVGDFAHLGGYLTGLVLALATGLHRDGLREGLAVRARLVHTDGDLGATEHAATKLLALVPDHAEARLARARRRSLYQRSPEGRLDYVEAIRVLLDRDRSEAARVFVEYYRKYGLPLPAPEQLQLTAALESIGQLDIASQCLERLIDASGTRPQDREKALLYDARLLVAMGVEHAAIHAYQRLLREHPRSGFRAVVEAKLAALLERDAERSAGCSARRAGASGACAPL